MNRLSTLLTLIAIGTVVLPTNTSAASRFAPPTLVMTDTYNKVAVAVVERGPREGSVAFTRRQTLHGDVPESWVARIDAAALEEIAWGRPYVVGYTEVRRNPLNRETREIDPDGPRVLTLPVVGPALLEDSPEIRSLFDAVRTGEVEPGRGYLDALLGLLAGSGARARRFAVSEFYLRQDLYAVLQPGDVTVLRNSIASTALGSEPRAMLLEASGRFPRPLRHQWPAEVARQIVSTATADLDLNSTEPLLVKTAIETLAPFAVLADGTILARQVGSNSPGVAKAALQALELFDPDLAAISARQVLDAGDPHPTTRQALEQFLQRHRAGQSGG